MTVHTTRLAHMKTVSELAKEAGISPNGMRERLKRVELDLMPSDNEASPIWRWKSGTGKTSAVLYNVAMLRKHAAHLFEPDSEVTALRDEVAQLKAIVLRLAGSK